MARPPYLAKSLVKSGAKSRSKFGSVATVVDGRRFASKAEARRYLELQLLQRAGVISDLECQPRYPLVVGNVTVGVYVADFRYTNNTDGRLVVEDVKSVATKTQVYRLKARLMVACHGINVVEVM